MVDKTYAFMEYLSNLSDMAKNVYGERHKAARKEKLDELSAPKCEVTGGTKNLEAHHSVPRLFNGPDMASNYQILTSHFHQQVLHVAINIQDVTLVKQRTDLTKLLQKNLLDDDTAKKIHKEIKKIDSIMIEQYIENILNKLSYEIREKVIKLTMINSFETIRDQNIEITRLRKMLEAIQVT